MSSEAGSASDPAARAATAAGFLFFIAALNLGLGLFAVLGETRYLAGHGAAIGWIVAGLIYAGLAYRVKVKRSRGALVLAIALFTLDGFLSIWGSDEGVVAGALSVRLFLLIPLWNARSAFSDSPRKPKVASWTDRRALSRQQQQDARKALEAPRPPGR